MRPLCRNNAPTVDTHRVRLALADTSPRLRLTRAIVITQSDIVKLLATVALNSNHDAATELKTATLEMAGVKGASGLGADLASQLRCSTDSAKAATAFEMMEELRVTSVPVLATKAALGLQTTTVLSTSDVMAVWETGSFKPLAGSVLDLVKGRRARQLNITAPAVVIRPTATFAAATGRLAATRTHRLYVEIDGKTSGVFSLSDVLRAVMQK